MKPVTEMIDLDPPLTATAAASRSERVPSKLVDYYELTKPRMNFLVLVTTAVGYYVASAAQAHVERMLLVYTLLGTAACAAAAAILNQVIERDYDKLMPRTRNRPLPTGRIATNDALLLGTSLAVAGVAFLAIIVNSITAVLGALTIFSYLALYTPAKRVTSLNTVIGAIPGALPPVMGFTAATGTLSPGALAIFGILFLWQMPHFLAIAILYRNDYRAGGFKMLPCVEADQQRLPFTGQMMVLYAIALVPVSVLPSMLKIAGPLYFTIAVLLGFGFLSFAVACATSGGARADARRLFFASIVYLPFLLGAMMIDRVSP